jgi:hypothetical protein
VGVTDPDDDVTELSARKKAAEDATLLSAREPGDAANAAAAADAADVTVLSQRPHPVAEADDDGTRLSPRTPDDGTQLSARASADDTRVSPRSPAPRVRAATRATKPERPALPPGVLGGAAAELGSFGQAPAEYAARQVGEPASAAPMPPVARPIPEPSAPDAEHVRSRREAARHRKLITTVIVVAVTAALMTAAIFGIIALVGAAA